jgi:hypothetical protein
MQGVDFGDAQLRYVEFRGLDMTNVRWPTDGNHIVVSPYLPALERALNVFKAREGDVGAKRLVAMLSHLRKWAGSKQSHGCFNMAHLIETVGTPLAQEFLDVLREK